jgi:hypothetical protein
MRAKVKKNGVNKLPGNFSQPGYILKYKELKTERNSYFLEKKFKIIG